MTSGAWSYLIASPLLIAVTSPIWGFNYEKIRAIRRKEYILRNLALMVVGIPLTFLAESDDPGLAILALLALIPIGFILIYSTVQRTKDAGVSKHWTWTLFLPLMSIVPVIVFMVLPTKAKAEAQAGTAG